MPATSDAVPLLGECRRDFFSSFSWNNLQPTVPFSPGTYFNCIMFMVASSVVSTILILNYHHRNADTHEMSEWVRKFSQRIQVELQLKRTLKLTASSLPFQIKVIFLYWLPCILRMTRPTRGLNCDYPATQCSEASDRKQQLHEVELRERWVILVATELLTNWLTDWINLPSQIVQVAVGECSRHWRRLSTQL